VVLALDDVIEGLDAYGEAKERNKAKDVNVLHDLMLQQRLERVDAQQRRASNVWVVINVVAVHVMLDNVLVNPIKRAAADPVLRKTQEAVHHWVARHSSVVRVVLDIQANQLRCVVLCVVWVTYVYMCEACLCLCLCVCKEFIWMYRRSIMV